MKEIVYAETLKELYEAWKPLHKRVYLTFKKFKGQKPGHMIGDALISEDWWPLDYKCRRNDFRLVKIAFHDIGEFICSFKLTYSDDTVSPILGYVPSWETNTEFVLPRSVKVAKVAMCYYKKKEKGKKVFMLAQFKLFDSEGKLIYCGGRNNYDYNLWKETAIPYNETFIGIRCARSDKKSVILGLGVVTVCNLGKK